MAQLLGPFDMSKVSNHGMYHVSEDRELKADKERSIVTTAVKGL